MIKSENTNKIVIIGGYNYLSPTELQYYIKTFKTPYGESAQFLIPLNKNHKFKNFIILNRHGLQHEVAPSQINWRANFWAIKYGLKINNIISYAAVGSLKKRFLPGMLVLLSDFLDLSITRPTFSKSGSTRGVLHADLSTPFCPRLRKALLRAAELSDLLLEEKGVYLTVEGPRFETP